MTLSQSQAGKYMGVVRRQSQVTVREEPGRRTLDGKRRVCTGEMRRDHRRTGERSSRGGRALPTRSLKTSPCDPSGQTGRLHGKQRENKSIVYTPEHPSDV